ncbi:MAG: hypothetical protein AAFX09_09710 [Pseudomonadota bacterium]
MSAPLPVIDILNNLITVNNYLMASQAAKLPQAVTKDPVNNKTVQKFIEWQERIWEEYYEGLVNAQIVAQTREIHHLYSIDAITQREVRSILYGDPGGPTPKAVSLCDDVTNLISEGAPLVDELTAITEGIRDADKQKVESLLGTVKTLNDQFDEDEQKITEGAFKTAEDIFATVVDVAIAVGSEGEAIEPLVKGVTQVGKDAVNQIILTQDAKHVLSKLIDAWAELDEATADLAQMTMVVNQLNEVVKDQSTALTALDAIVSDWQAVADLTNEPRSEWDASGKAQIDEWSSRMSRVNFSAATQTIQKSDLE